MDCDGLPSTFLIDDEQFVREFFMVLMPINRDVKSFISCIAVDDKWFQVNIFFLFFPQKHILLVLIGIASRQGNSCEYLKHIHL